MNWDIFVLGIGFAATGDFSIHCPSIYLVNLSEEKNFYNVGNQYILHVPLKKNSDAKNVN